MSYGKRIYILYFCLLLCLWLLYIRLYIVTFRQNKALTVLDGQYSSKLEVTSRSGFIYDRYFSVMSHDMYTGILVVNPSEIDDMEFVSKKLSDVTTYSTQDDIQNKIRKGIPFTVLSENTDKAKELSKNTPGVYYNTHYSENTSTAPHLLGYCRNGVGVTGMRYHYDDMLQKRMSAKSYVTFSHDGINRSMSTLTIHNTDLCNDDGIITTIDKSLQMFCNSLEDKIKSGCVIVADSSNGEILALSSFPSYDADNLSQYLDSDKGELLNRAACSYTPGSVFKIIVSASALEENPQYINFTHTCKGSVQVDNRQFNCHRKEGHGTIDMKQAFAMSCNCYYVSLAKNIGMEKILRTAKKIGLDKPSCADFLTETSHHFTDESNHSPKNLANLSIGQGDLCLSPLDMINVMITSVTGYSVPTRIILGQVRNNRSIYREQSVKSKVFSEKTVDLLCNMMEECVNTGTGMGGKIEDVRMGGKTGTAQTGRFDVNGVEYVHKWFCGFYEGIEKRYVFCILSDNTPENKLSPAVVSSSIVSFLKENLY